MDRRRVETGGTARDAAVVSSAVAAPVTTDGRKRRVRSVPVREEGPSGNTVVTENEIEAAKRLFIQELPTATSGLSIVQRLATLASSAEVSSARVVGDLNGRSIGGANHSTTPQSRPKTLSSSAHVSGGSGVLEDDQSETSDDDDDGEVEEEEEVEDRHDEHDLTARYRDEASDPTPPRLPPRVTHTTMSQRVVNSHLDYFRKFEPFRQGRFTKDTLYQFLFYAVVENRLRMSYAKRVLRNLLSYVRRYLEENGGASDRVVVLLEKTNGRRSVHLEIELAPESVRFFRDNPRGTVVQSKLFYRLMNSIGDRTNNQRLKNVVCEARRPRDLVFSEHHNATLLAFVFRVLHVLVEKYVRRARPGDTVGTVPAETISGWSGTEIETETETETVTGRSSDTDCRVTEALESLVSSPTLAGGHATPKKELDLERTTFEFAVAFLLGFLTGARTKSTIARLTVGEIDRLIRGGTIEKLTKGSFARVFVPEHLVFTEYESPRTGRVRSLDHHNHHHNHHHHPDPFDPRDPRSVAKLLYETTLVRRDPLLYPARRLCKHVGSAGRCGYGEYRQCRNNKRRPLAELSPATLTRRDGTRECRAKTGRVHVGCPYGSVECERELNELRAHGECVRVEEQMFFLSGDRQLDHAFDRIYAKLFQQRRPRGVLWHSQRRRYLGAVNERYGAVIASKSVGHTDVETTMSYINRSMHREDTNRRAGSAVYEEMMRLVDATRQQHTSFLDASNINSRSSSSSGVGGGSGGGGGGGDFGDVGDGRSRGHVGDTAPNGMDRRPGLNLMFDL